MKRLSGKPKHKKNETVKIYKNANEYFSETPEERLTWEVLTDNQKLRVARSIALRTQAELALVLGIHDSEISRIENGMAIPAHHAIRILEWIDRTITGVPEEILNRMANIVWGK